MKFITNIIPLFLLFALSISMSSCGSSKDKKGPEYTSAYICPMHCEGSGSAKPGQCPVCKMDYEANTEKAHGHSHDGHDHHGHDHNHEGHDHNHDHDGHDHNHDHNHEGHNH